ncbi:unnamed protein product [Tuber melanosporum]|uniref:(Perigord truffle) hypothetical protein n=1 Tax=Tuber melanosporum (strain Mel28) TaxID=656061 RepID=D5GD46_TUBMM|nr:uncharacterized protein GSTUM_00000970001 [Tuber melanosporum]CAZ82439.1 unnamed protein product [Tuber melanosporum]
MFLLLLHNRGVPGVISDRQNSDVHDVPFLWLPFQSFYFFPSIFSPS